MYGELPVGHSFRATQIAATVLWTVVPVDDEERPYAGGQSIVGPDRRVWAISSNPGIHDSDLAVDALQALYHADVAHRVEADHFHEWLSSETRRRNGLIPALVAAAVDGSMMKTNRRLP
jgi:hypothetical protein